MNLRQLPFELFYRTGIFTLGIRYLFSAVLALFLLLFPEESWLKPRSYGFLLAGFIFLYTSLFHRKIQSSPFIYEEKKLHLYRKILDHLDLLSLTFFYLLTGGYSGPFFPLFLLGTMILSFPHTVPYKILIFFESATFLLVLALLPDRIPSLSALFPLISPLGEKGIYMFFIYLLFLGVGFFGMGVVEKEIRQWAESVEEKRREIKRWEQFLQDLFHHLPIGILVTGPGGEILHKNQFVQNLFHLDSDPQTNILRAKVVENSNLAPYLQDFFYGKPLYLNEFPFLTPNGEKRWLKIIGIPPSPTTLRATLLFFDITEDIQRTEEERVFTQKLLDGEKYRTLGQLATGIAHEINTPLSTIFSVVELLEQRIQEGKIPTSDIPEKLKIIYRQGKRIHDIVKYLLHFGSPKRGAPQPLSLPSILQEVLLLLEFRLRKEKISVTTEVSPELKPVMGFRVELEQIFLNLLTNAIDACSGKENGKIEVRIYPSVEKDEEGVVVEIQDNGPGIDPRIRDQVFQPFFTTKPHGTGLGLAITQTIVQRYGGSIRIVTGEEKTEGATFRVFLPYHPAQMTSTFLITSSR
jgi:signal transduction histidine kinase